MFFKSDKKNQDQVRGFSHLGENFRFEGEIDCKGEIEIAGKIKGNVKAKKIENIRNRNRQRHSPSRGCRSFGSHDGQYWF